MVCCGSGGNKSNLGNLFGASTQPTAKESSLAYQRPKAPSKTEASTAKAASKSALPALLFTTQVDLYKTYVHSALHALIQASNAAQTLRTSSRNLLLSHSLLFTPYARPFTLFSETPKLPLLHRPTDVACATHLGLKNMPFFKKGLFSLSFSLRYPPFFVLAAFKSDLMRPMMRSKLT